MYLSFARLFCEINIISQEISRAESEYMQAPPPKYAPFRHWTGA